jgi:hypothetical protein
LGARLKAAKGRRQKAEELVERCQEEARRLTAALSNLRDEVKARDAARAREARDRHERVREHYDKRMASVRARLELAKEKLGRAEMTLGKIEAQADIAGRKRAWNLGTSLKSYINPRVYHDWGQKVGYDVLRQYYPTILQRKFAWVRLMDDPLDGAPQNGDALEPRGEGETAGLAEDSAAGRPAVEDEERD